MDTKSVETLLAKAAVAEDPVQAMNFAQAALNAAHALRQVAEFHVLSRTWPNNKPAK